MDFQHKTAAYLMNASHFLPDEPQYMYIRSNIIAKCVEQLKQFPYNLNRCSACGVNFKNVPPSQQIQSVPTLNRFLRRHLHDKYYKTKYQAIRMKKFNRKLHNRQKIVNICNMCNKKQIRKLMKPSNIITSKVIDQASRKETNIVKKRLKRLQKKKKNREFAGLNESVVLSVANYFKENNPSTSVICLDDTSSPERSSASTTSPKNANVLNSSPIMISDCAATISSASGKDLTGNETDNSVIVLDSPISKSKPSFFIDTKPGSSNQIKKLNKSAVVKSFKSLNYDISPIATSLPGPSNSTNVNQTNTNNQKSKLSKKQKKLLKQNKNVNGNSTFVMNAPNTPQAKAGRRKKKKNRILAQPIKKDKKSQKLNSLANLLNNNDNGTRVKSTSMLSQFLESVS